MDKGVLCTVRESQGFPTANASFGANRKLDRVLHAPIINMFKESLDKR